MITAAGIYQIKNKINNKCYIGSSVDIHKRLRKHLSDLLRNKHNNRYLQNSWNKYGCSNFIFNIIGVTKDKNDLIKLEQYWLDYYCSYDRENGYNVRENAESNLGLKATEETKIKMSLSGKGKKKPQSFINKISGKDNPFYGRKHTKEAITKIIKNRIGVPLSETHKYNISNANKGNKAYWYGRKHSKKTRDKISEAGKGRKPSVETIIKRTRKNSIITEIQARIIKKLLKNKLLKQSEISCIMNIQYYVINTINRGLTWKHI